MCGRYTLSITDKPDLKRLGLQLFDRYNITPQTKVLIVKETGEITLMHWGFSAPWARKPSDFFNARSETLAEKPSFSAARRCAFIADGWYEWQRLGTIKQPWYHHRGGEVIHFGGVYHSESGCAIVTKSAENQIGHIHHRQPLLLSDQGLANWLAGDPAGACADKTEISFHKTSQEVDSSNVNKLSLKDPISHSPQFGQKFYDLFEDS